MADRGLDFTYHTYQVDPASVSDEQQRWLDGLPQAPMEERDATLRDLRQIDLSNIDDPQPLHLIGLGLVQLQKPDEALTVFKRAFELDTNNTINGINVAVALIEVRQAERARQQLSALAGRTDGASAIARRYLGDLDRALAEADRELRFTELQAASSRERLRSETADTEERLRLARLLISLVVSGRPGYSWDEPIQILESVRAADPRNVEALELLVPVYMDTGRSSLMHQVLRDLEEIAPDSAMLSLLSGRRADRESGPSSQELRTGELLATVMAGGSDADAAVHTLRKLVQRFPRNQSYRTTLMFAEAAGSKNMPGALAHAEVLERESDPTHELHFNIAQVFWRAGQRARAEAHFAEASRLASSDRERQDVDDILEYLRRDDP